jgi:hypothetical protein
LEHPFFLELIECFPIGPFKAVEPTGPRQIQERLFIELILTIEQTTMEFVIGVAGERRKELLGRLLIL